MVRYRKTANDSSFAGYLFLGNPWAVPRYYHIMDTGLAELRKREWVPASPFQDWAKQRLQERGMTPVELHRTLVSAGVDITESYVYRLVRGRVGKEKPGYDIVLAIGRALGDPIGAITTAGYEIPGMSTSSSVVGLSDWVSLYSGATEEQRGRLLSAVRSLVGTTRN